MNSPKEYIENKIQKRKLKEYIKNYILVVFIVFVFLAGVVLGKMLLVKETDNNTVNTSNTSKDKTSSVDTIFNAEKIENIISILKSKYYDSSKISDQKIFDGALAGIVSSVGDPYTTYFNEELTKSFSEEMSGSFSGIGAEIAIKDNTLTVVAPLPNTPAEKAGIKAGDKILKINNEDTNGMSSDLAVSKIRGEKGTEVLLSIYQTDTKATKDFKIIRDNIIVESVTYEKKNNIAVITISSFNDNTSSKFQEVVKNITADKTIKGIVLDLRNNPGGYLSTAIDVSSYWLNRDDIVVSEKNKNNETNPHKASGSNVLTNYKTAVLINEGSASASEIVSGALHDHNKATLIGKKSFGKGSVQEYQEFGDGTAIKVTVAEWFTPNGLNINKNGINPDVEVDYTLDDFNKNKDPQMDKAIEYILKK